MAANEQEDHGGGKLGIPGVGRAMDRHGSISTVDLAIVVSSRLIDRCARGERATEALRLPIHGYCEQECVLNFYLERKLSQGPIVGANFNVRRSHG